MNKLLILSVLFYFYSNVTYSNLRFEKHLKLVTFDFPPLEYQDSMGKTKGIAVEIVKKIFSDLGYRIKIKVLPWTRALKLTKEGEMDAIFTAYKNSEREKFLDYTNEVLVPQIVAFYSKKDHPPVFDGNLKELAGLKIGVTSTISYGQKFDKARKYLKVERADSLDLNMKKLVSGRLSFVISNIYTASEIIKRLKLHDKIVRLKHEVERVPSYLAFSKKNKHGKLVTLFDQKLIEMKENGSYDKILAKYNITINPT